MSNIVKYGVKPDTALVILDTVASSPFPLERSEIADITGYSLMTVGKAADMFVSAGVFSSSRGYRADAGRKPEILSVSDAVFILISFEARDCLIKLINPDGSESGTHFIESCHPDQELFSALMNISERRKCLAASVLFCPQDETRIRKTSTDIAVDTASIVSAAAGVPVMFSMSAIDIAARENFENESLLYLSASDIHHPASRFVSENGVSRVGDISAALSPDPTEKEIGELAAVSALLCGADRLALHRCSDRIKEAAKKRLNGRIAVSEAKEVDAAVCVISMTKEKWLKNLCLSAKK